MKKNERKIKLVFYIPYFMQLQVGKFVHTQTGRMLMSVILGLGLASLFRTVCKGNQCTVFHAPPLADLTDKIYKNKNGCVKYTPVATTCSLNSKTVTFE
jgi:hypothetical protein